MESADRGERTRICRILAVAVDATDATSSSRRQSASSQRTPPPLAGRRCEPPPSIRRPEPHNTNRNRGTYQKWNRGRSRISSSLECGRWNSGSFRSCRLRADIWKCKRSKKYMPTRFGLEPRGRRRECGPFSNGRSAHNLHGLRKCHACHSRSNGLGCSVYLESSCGIGLILLHVIGKLFKA
jgi:hypothetical protein